jgi:predicted GTPase
VATFWGVEDCAIEFGTGNIFQSILNDYEALGIVGEESNKLMCYLAATTRLMEKPLNILVLSSSGAGKSTLQDKTLRLMPPEDVIRTSAISDKALFYQKSLKG